MIARLETAEGSDWSDGGAVARVQGRVWAALGLAPADGHPHQGAEERTSRHSPGEGQTGHRCQGQYCL